jgi:D-galactarolactone isomerase
LESKRLNTPNRPLPPLACDCHMHVFEPRFGVGAGPPAPMASAAMYRQVQARLGLQRVVVVQANRYGSDNRGMLDALAELGHGARGVAVVEPNTSEAELQRLTALGVRGVRFHMLPGGHLQWAQLDAVAARVRPFGWHVQLQLDGWTLPMHAARLQALPVDIVIDHIGKFVSRPPPRVGDPAFRALLGLLDGGHCWVKLSAPYESSRVAAPTYDDVAPLARASAASHAERCLWGSNWPHPGRMPPPSEASLLDTFFDWGADERRIQRILVDSPQQLYGFALPAPQAQG